jgi:hypothetical protein
VARPLENKKKIKSGPGVRAWPFTLFSYFFISLFFLRIKKKLSISITF